MDIPTSAQGIYDRLIGDAVISDALGVYVLPGGQELPAISVLAGGQTLPPGTATGGIEVAITATPSYAPQLLMGFETLLRPTWRIYVIAWGALGELQEVIERIITLLPGATTTDIPADPPGEGLGVIEQTVITWTNPCVVSDSE